jgi:hypothetical protein
MSNEAPGTPAEAAPTTAASPETAVPAPAVATFNGIPIPVKGAVAPMVMMKGGTTSSGYDRQMAQKVAEAESRRQHEDRVADMIENQQHLGGIGRIGAQKFVTKDSPRLILYYLNRDGSIRQECVSEITMIPKAGSPGELDMMFTLVCPRCLERGLVAAESQLMIQSSHRKFHFDDRKKSLVELIGPDGPFMVHQAGTVTVDNTIRCSNYNCNWAVRIDDSKVREV